ncbi:MULTISPECIES: winged helix-turn-helix transcriptional regulator [unclassified Micromonospora]|uniref:winged helix-turn-helix transcriptional regulator n=1 Tax=unclassified Micromonospora TaxID=2617518 RepID=UPI003635705F
MSECVDQTCPVAAAVRVLDGKWTVLVVRDLLGGTRRFTELRASLVGISPKTLTDRLRALEEAAWSLVPSMRRSRLAWSTRSPRPGSSCAR